MYKMQIAQMSKLQNSFLKISVLHESWNVSQTVVMRVSVIVIFALFSGVASTLTASIPEAAAEATTRACADKLGLTTG